MCGQVWKSRNKYCRIPVSKKPSYRRGTPEAERYGVSMYKAPRSTEEGGGVREATDMIGPLSQAFIQPETIPFIFHFEGH